jgi:integrase
VAPRKAPHHHARRSHRERREIPLPKQAVDLLRELQEVAPTDCPYVFREPARWDYYREQSYRGTWSGTTPLANNVLRRFSDAVSPGQGRMFTVHDLRRSCITHWARSLPIHVSQKLAGQADIQTTRQYYLSVQEDDLRAAGRAQQQTVKGRVHIAATEQKLTNSAQKRCFPKRNRFADGTQLRPEAEVA